MSLYDDIIQQKKAFTEKYGVLPTHVVLSVADSRKAARELGLPTFPTEAFFAGLRVAIHYGTDGPKVGVLE